MTLSADSPKTTRLMSRDTDRQADDLGDGEGEGFSLVSWQVIAGVALLVSALTILVVAMSERGGDGGDIPLAESATVASIPGGTDSGSDGAAAVAPTVPEGMSPTMADTTPIAADSFDRSHDPEAMGETETGQRWVADTGVWGIDDDKAYVSGPVVVPLTNRTVLEGVSVSQGVIQADVSTLKSGSGLLFRYKGPFNYYTVMPVQEFVAWRVQKVVDGERQLVGMVDHAAIKDGTNVAVQLEGQHIDIYIDGQPAARFDDNDLVFAGGVGLAFAGEGSGAARVDNFEVGQIGDGGFPGFEDDGAEVEVDEAES